MVQYPAPYPLKVDAMTLTIPDRTIAATFAAATGTGVEVRGPDGQLLGRFHPAPRPGMSCPEFGMTDEELLRELNDPDATWVTAEEVNARMRELRGQN